MAHLYGHAPPPKLTMNEQLMLERITDEYQTTSALSQGLNTASVSVALVRLRHRDMVESQIIKRKQHWRRKREP